jgi:hypothetical protein
MVKKRNWRLAPTIAAYSALVFIKRIQGVGRISRVRVSQALLDFSIKLHDILNI